MFGKLGGFSFLSSPLSILAALMTTVACSSEGDIHFQKTEKPVVIKDERISAEQALQKLFATKNLKERKAVVQEITAISRPDFNWNLFWERLTVSPEVSDYEQEDWDVILPLHSMSCSTQHYRKFARLVVDRDLGIAWVSGNLQTCTQVSLGQPLFEDAMKLGFKKFKEDEFEVSFPISNMIFQEFRHSTDKSWKHVLDYYSDGDWSRLAHVMWANGESEQLVRLSSVFFSFSGADGLSAFQHALVDPLIESTDFYADSIENVRLSGVLGFLVSVPEWKWGRVSRSDVASFFDRVMVSFENEEMDLEESVLDRWESKWKKWRQIRTLLSRSQDRLPFDSILVWAERAVRSMERDLVEHPDTAEYFLREKWSDLDGRFLSIRLGSRYRWDLVMDPLPSAGGFLLDQAVRKRTAIHLSENSQEKRERRIEYCEFLGQNGVATREIDEAEFLENPLMVQSPGCIQIKPKDTDREVVLTQESFVMAFDSVVVFPVERLRIEAKVFDGSIFDLTVPHYDAEVDPRIPDLKFEVTDEIRDVDAVMIPILGCFLLTRDYEFELGMHQGYQCYVVHFPFQYAEAGDSEPVELLKGFSGGDLVVQTQLSDLSTPPTLVSLGGKGQRDMREDGRASVSSLSRPVLSQWLLQVNLNQERLDKPTYHLHSAPPMIVLNELMRRAEKDPDILSESPIATARFYINWQYTLALAGVLDREILKRFDYICGDRERDTCFEEVIRPRVETFVKDRIAEYPEESNQILPEFAGSYRLDRFQREEKRKRGETGEPGSLVFE